MEWKTSKKPVDYPEALEFMERRAEAIAAGAAPEMVWLLEHPPLYTAGTSAKPADLLDGNRFPVYPVGRGGQYTYHGPGQRIAYVMLNLKKRSPGGIPDLRAYVQSLECWIIATLKQFGVEGFTRKERIGVWVKDSGSRLQASEKMPPEPAAWIPDPESKIAALGIRVRRGVSYHGIAINVHPDLSHYAGIVPCGINNYGVTSLKRLGVQITMSEVDQVLRQEFERQS